MHPQHQKGTCHKRLYRLSLFILISLLHHSHLCLVASFRCSTIEHMVIRDVLQTQFPSPEALWSGEGTPYGSPARYYRLKVWRTSTFGKTVKNLPGQEQDFTI